MSFGQRGLSRLLVKTRKQLSLVVLSVLCFPAVAGILTYNLSGFVFNDGATASGFLKLDSTTGAVVDFDVVTTFSTTPNATQSWCELGPLASEHCGQRYSPTYDGTPDPRFFHNQNTPAGAFSSYLGLGDTFASTGELWLVWQIGFSCDENYPFGDLMGSVSCVSALHIQVTPPGPITLGALQIQVGFTEFGNSSIACLRDCWAGSQGGSIPGLFDTWFFNLNQNSFPRTSRSATAGQLILEVTNNNTVSEPATLGLIGLCLAGLAFTRRRARQAAR